MEFKEFIYKSLKDLYNKDVFDVDKDEESLRKLGFNLENTRIPDFIINLDNTVLIELKEIDEKKEDVEIKEKLSQNSVVSFWEPELKNNFKNKIKEANKQFKEFILNNNDKFGNSFITVVLLKCKSFTANYTIENAEEFINGILDMTITPFGKSIYQIKNKLFNENRYTSTVYVGIWNGKNKFHIYKNIYNAFSKSTLLFITKNDIFYFLLKDKLMKDYGIRVKRYKIIDFNKKEVIRYLINEQYVSENDLISYIKNLKIQNKKLNEELKKFLFRNKI